MIAIIDYGLGNIQAFANIYRRLNIAARIVQTASDLATARKIILPGVGAFDWAMSRLEASGMRPTLDSLVLTHQRPVLGVCVGMQMMAKRSDEGVMTGLGWFDAEVKRFDDTHFPSKTHLPHMGWNNVSAESEGLFAGLKSPLFYFLHSYYFAPGDSKLTLGVTDYNGRFTSAASNGNIFGVQFHPEKSHQWGVQLLKNFAEL